MNAESVVCSATGASEVGPPSHLQTLWSGYGSIVRYQLIDATHESVIVKHVSPPVASNHPRGWNTDFSNKRKLNSYRVESEWYRRFAVECDDFCRVAKCFGIEKDAEEVLLVLEDLDAAGFPNRRRSVSDQELKACISWLASFHGRFLQMNPTGLWPTGTYWHLGTRPDELEALRAEAPELAAAAGELDRRLQQTEYQTIVHGDAKLANFCFAADGSAVAAVDFQYAGGGCGMKDLAYFVGSCLNEEECSRREGELLDYYFASLRSALARRGIDGGFKALESDWRALYPLAWADFHRFLRGWSPGHWKINSYSERITREVLSKL